MFDPYGRVTVLDENGNPRTVNESLYGNPWTFTGRRLDGETGLMQFRNRMYSVDLGSFVSRDPIGFVDGLSLYRAYFVPLYTDPTGLWEIVRTGQPRAVAVPNSPGDTIIRLARDLKLDWTEYEKWLTIECKEPMNPYALGHYSLAMFDFSRSPFAECCSFTVPNRVYIDLGDSVWWTFWLGYTTGGVFGGFYRHSVQVDVRARADGFLSTWTRSATDAQIEAHMGDKDLYRYYFYGHGDGAGIINSGEYPPRGVTPEKYTKFGISFMALFACGSLTPPNLSPTAACFAGGTIGTGSQIIWRTNVSSLGTLVGYTVNKRFTIDPWTSVPGGLKLPGQ
jgi:RHS repeat-associated protein